MDTAIRLTQLQSAEDLFAMLGVACDPKVIAVHRMRILRRFGQALKAIHADGDKPSDAELNLACAQALSEIHEQCARGCRDPEPLLLAAAPQLVQLRTKRSRETS